MINKKFVMFGAILGMTAGGMLPALWGANVLMDPLAILTGMIGGFVGIWLAVKLSKRFG